MPVAGLMAIDLACLALLAMSSVLGAHEGLQRPVLIATSLASMAGVGAFVWRAVTRPGDSGMVVLHLAFVFWYLMPMLLWNGFHSTFFAAGLALSGGHVIEAATAVFLAKSLLSAFYLVLRGSWIRARAHEPSKIEEVGRGVPILLVALHLLLGLIPFFVSGAGLFETLLAGRSSASVLRQTQVGNAETMILLLSFFLISAALLAIHNIFLKTSDHVRLLSIVIAVVAALLVAVAMGTRSLLIAIFPPALMAYRIRTKLSARTLLVAGVAFATLYFSSALMVTYRQVGFSAVLSGDNPDAESRLFIDSDFFAELVYSMDIFPSIQRYSYESPLLLTALNVVPRAWWPEKPGARNTELFMRFRLGRPAGDLLGNVLPGIIGQYWHVAGWPGVIVMSWWLAFFARWVGGKMAHADPSSHYLLLVVVWSVFISFRYIAASNFVPIALALATVGIGRRLDRGTKLLNRRRPPAVKRQVEVLELSDSPNQAVRL